VALPPSLRNIFKELQRDLGTPPPPFPNPGGSLVKWANHGVLLLNTCLTVEEGQPASHSGRGWEVLTDAVIRHVHRRANRCFHAVGRARPEQACADRLQRHKVLVSNHPSPLSALRPPCPSSAAAFRRRRGPGGRRAKRALKSRIILRLASCSSHASSWCGVL
jgi:uracil-DNA glycosylase